MYLRKKLLEKMFEKCSFFPTHKIKIHNKNVATKMIKLSTVNFYNSFDEISESTFAEHLRDQKF